MKRLIKSPWGVLLGLMLLQWAWASFLALHVAKSKSLPGDKIRIEARRAVNWGHFVPVFGALLLIEPIGDYNITIEGFGQREIINEDMITDFPWEYVRVDEGSDTVSLVDDAGKTYATFQK
jgi:hypothetical protein